MTFGLAAPGTITQLCERFKSVLANYVFEKKITDEKSVKLIAGDRFADLVIDLCNMFGEHFHGVRLPKPVLAFLSLGTSGTMANFQPDLWQVAVNDALIFAKGDFPRKFAPVVFSSLYHEYRHAEQFGLMIRYAWAQHPDWLRYQNIEYSVERNVYAPKSHQVPESARVEAYGKWEHAVRKMSDSAMQSLISGSLSTVGGAKVSLKAVRSLRQLPLGILHGDTQQMMNQAALWYQSRFRTWAEEFGGRTQLFDPGRMFDADETSAANIASADASVSADTVDAELKEWNKAKPTAFPNWPISQSYEEGRALSQLRVGSRPFNAAAARTCHAYLTARRKAAIDLLHVTHDWYESVPLEADTHELERRVADELKMSSRVVDSVAKGTGVLKDKYLPEPKDWSAQL